MEDKDAIQTYLQNYIEENRDTYRADVIRAKLLDAGHHRDEINSAFAALGMDVEKGKNNGSASKSNKAGSGNWRDAPTNAGYFLLFFPLIPVVAYFLPLFAYGLTNNDSVGFGSFSLIALGTLLAGTFLPMRLKHTNPSAAKGIMYGFRTLLVIFVVLPILGICTLWGICIVGNGGSMY